MQETIYPIGTIVNCNRCDEQFVLVRPYRGYPLQTTCARLHDFAMCAHCHTLDCHWVYAKNNPRFIPLKFEHTLLAFVFDEPEQAQVAIEYLRARNIFLMRRTHWVLVARTAADGEATLIALADYERKRTAHPI